MSANEAKWRKVESILDKDSKLTPDESADLFIELSDDLSYAHTHYPHGVITGYLNALAIGIFGKLNKRKTEKLERIVSFWRFEVPLCVARHHRRLLYSFLFFAASLTIGIVSTHYDETFPRVVLSDEYVDMTLENIENNDPMAVYKSSESNSMFLRITFNNIRVSLYTFAAGLLFSLGTVYFLFYNGVMVGAFQYFFIQKGVILDSLLTIWIHGTIEISCIIIAGGAGLVLGHSFLFPGTLPRMKSLVLGAKDAIKIVVGIIPLIVLAGFLESFITRLTASPAIFRVGIIFLSLLFVLWYFVYYPRRLAQKLQD